MGQVGQDHYTPSVEILATATSLFVKSTILAVNWAGASRRNALESIASMPAPDKDKEIVFLRDRIEQLELQLQILLKNAGKKARSPRYNIAERLHVIWFVEYFQIPRRRVSDYLGIARSTLYRWLRRIDDAAPALVPHNRTPNEVAQLELLKGWHVNQRLGAVGKHGSIAVTERVIETLKYEWLFRVPLIGGIDHLESLCQGSLHWCNGWRPHMTLGGATPNDFYCRDVPEPVPHDAKVVPPKIERRRFAETRVTGFRLPRAGAVAQRGLSEVAAATLE